ncbi:NUDIX hydrolase [Candidatus Latescibacterota bacterium]
MAQGHDPVTRDLTATTFLVEGGKTLLLWHNKMQAWLPPGGHMAENELPDRAALREVGEETGLTVEMLGEQAVPLGEVTVLPTPVCVLLEDIEPGHQHIDLIYFARVLEGRARVNPREASECRWFSPEDLESPEIAEDIRVLGRRAIAAAAG